MEDGEVSPEEYYPEEKEGGYAPYVNPFASPNYNVVDKQLEIKPTLEGLRDWLMGVKSRDETGEPNIDDELKMVNERGANALISLTSSGLVPQVTLGYISDEDHNINAEEFELDLPFLLIQNKEEWEVNMSHKDVIVNSLSRIFSVGLSRAIQGATHKGITKISMVHEQLIQKAGGQPKEEKKGFWENFGFKKR